LVINDIDEVLAAETATDDTPGLRLAAQHPVA